MRWDAHDKGFKFIALCDKSGKQHWSGSCAWEEQWMWTWMDPTLRDALNVNCGVDPCVVSVANVLYPSASCGRMLCCCFLYFW